MHRYNTPTLMVIWRAICCNLLDIRKETKGGKLARLWLEMAHISSTGVTRDKERDGLSFVPCVAVSRLYLSTACHRKRRHVVSQVLRRYSRPEAFYVALAPTYLNFPAHFRASHEISVIKRHLSSIQIDTSNLQRRNAQGKRRFCRAGLRGGINSIQDVHECICVCRQQMKILSTREGDRVW